ncbi:unnamed protein product [Vicia faba]|uniref:Uncharacterized protein n=1 Tax=Vicia faba TaxID=3906 RepID=A0AAV1BC00_VICFA|nr:unnamed protein product [Vicia faba]
MSVWAMGKINCRLHLLFPQISSFPSTDSHSNLDFIEINHFLCSDAVYPTNIKKNPILIFFFIFFVSLFTPILTSKASKLKMTMPNLKNHPSIHLHSDHLPLNIFPLIPIQTLTLILTISSPSLNSTSFIEEQNRYLLFSETF